MKDHYDHLSDITTQFHNKIVSNQKLLNDLRKKQFESMSRKDSKIDVDKIRLKINNIQKKEAQQLVILAKEMNAILFKKIQDIQQKEDFREKEMKQKQILQNELKNELIKSKKYFISSELQDKLIPVVLHLDILSDKIKNPSEKKYLDQAKNNILLYMESFSKELETG